MLKEIVFDLVPTTIASQTVQAFLQSLEQTGVNYAVSSAAEYLPVLSPEYCLLVTDSAAGIASARSRKLPCIGYAPAENTEDMSGAYALFEDFASIDMAYLCRTHAHAIGCPAEILSTQRLTVREFSKEDFPSLYTMCTDPSTASFMKEELSDYETEQKKHNAYLRTVYPFFDLALWGIYEKATGALIGRAGFSLPDETSDTFSIGYLIDTPFRRQGYAKELIPSLLTYAKEQGYERISAQIKKENIASVKVMEQCGYPYQCKEDVQKGTLTYVINLTE